MGPTWVTKWDPYGLPMCDPHGESNRDSYGSHMGCPYQALWAAHFMGVAMVCIMCTQSQDLIP